MTQTLFTTKDIGLTTALVSELSETLSEAEIFTKIQEILHRHFSGDWGNVDPQDARANWDALAHGDRILSLYEIEGTRVYVITEWDRSNTMIMRPVDY